MGVRRRVSVHTAGVKMERTWLLLCFLTDCFIVSSGLRSYYFVNQSMTWTEAQTYCRQAHTDLATVTDYTEMGKFVQSVSSVAEARSYKAWVGLRHQVDWKWSDGSSLTWNNYASQGGATYHTSTIIDYCMVARVNTTWTHSHCTSVYRFICNDATQKSSRYVLVSQKMTWSNARAYCRANHADLATVRDTTGEQAIQGLLPDADLTWIGLYSVSNNVWSDGSPFTPISIIHFLIIWPGQTNTHCASWNSVDGYHLLLTPCTQVYPFVCYGPAGQKTVLKLKLQTDDSVDLTNDAVKANLLRKLQEKLKVKETTAVKLEWRKQSDEEVFTEQKQEV